MSNYLFKSTTLLLAMTLLFSVFVIPVSATGALPVIGSSSSYGLLGTTVTVSAGLTVNGDLGAGGLTGSGHVTGSTNVADAAYTAAHTALENAIANASAQSADFTVTTPTDIGGTVLTPGVHKYSAAVNVGSNTTLDGPGVYIFNIAGALGTTAGTAFTLLNGANVCNIYWVVDAATLGANSTFSGTLMSRSAITLGANSVTIGRILARTEVTANAAATTVNVPTGCAAPTATPTATPIAAPTAATPTATPIATPTGAPTATPTAIPTTVPAPSSTPSPCLTGTTISPKAAGVVSIPTSAKLIANSSELSIWYSTNGNLIIHATLPNGTKASGTWTFNLGGKIYKVNGTEEVTYTAIAPPVGTYITTVQFDSNCTQQVVSLLSPTITVPTVTGGQLPNTATPWYNFLLLGTVLTFVGVVIGRRKKHNE